MSWGRPRFPCLKRLERSNLSFLHRFDLVTSAPRLLSLSIAMLWWLCASLVQAVERPGDVNHANELRQRALSAAATQRQLLAMTESAPRSRQFELYRTYDDSIGAWLQVELLRSLLDASAAATSIDDEKRLRTDLRDCARFAAWELDQHIANLDAAIARKGPAEYLRRLRALRSLAAQVRMTVLGLAAGE